MNAPEFPKNLKWFNSEPLTMAALRGRAVLIDFWTYSCVNCVRTLPYLKEWHERYSGKGLTIVGVHTPEFEFEKDPANVEKAIRDFGIKYPVVLDSEYLIWNSYSNHWWPRKFLINKDGKIVYDHVGEGGYQEAEHEIQKALREISSSIELPTTTKEEGSGGICYPTTPEIYLGSERGLSGKIWNYEGNWKIYTQYIEHAAKTTDFRDFILLKYQANEINLVLGTKDGKPAKIKVERNGEPLQEITVDSHRMYNLFKTEKHESGELKIYSDSDNLQAYAFTFGGCEK